MNRPDRVGWFGESVRSIGLTGAAWNTTSAVCCTVRQREVQRPPPGVWIGAVSAAVLAACFAGPLAIPLMGRWAAVAVVLGPSRAGSRGPAARTGGRRPRSTTGVNFRTGPRPPRVLRGRALGPFSAAVQDAVRRLEAVDPARVVERRLPRAWPAAPLAYAIAAGALVAVLLAVPPAVTVAAESPAEILAEADRLDEQAEELEKAADELDSEELRQLAALMRQTAAEMRKPGTDGPEAMAKLSELQAALAELKKATDPTAVDQELKELGAAVSGAKPLQEAGKALQELQLNKAAEAMEKAKGAKFDPREAKATEERLKQSAKQMEARGQPKLGKAAEKLASGVAGDKKNMDQGVKDLNQELKTQERRRRINQLMAQEQKRLDDCKSRCEQHNRNLMEQKNQSQNQSRPEGASPRRTPGGEDGRGVEGRASPPARTRRRSRARRPVRPDRVRRPDAPETGTARRSRATCTRSSRSSPKPHSTRNRSRSGTGNDPSLLRADPPTGARGRWPEAAPKGRWTLTSLCLASGS